MSKSIRFFWKTSGITAASGIDYFIRSDGTVWQDNYESYESQCSSVSFDDFVMPCPELDWEFVSDNTTNT